MWISTVTRTRVVTSVKPYSTRKSKLSYNNVGQYISKKFQIYLFDNGIESHISRVYTIEQNVVANSKNRHWNVIYMSLQLCVWTLCAPLLYICYISLQLCVWALCTPLLYICSLHELLVMCLYSIKHTEVDFHSIRKPFDCNILILPRVFLPTYADFFPRK